MKICNNSAMCKTAVEYGKLACGSVKHITGKAFGAVCQKASEYQLKDRAIAFGGLYVHIINYPVKYGKWAFRSVPKLINAAGKSENWLALFGWGKAHPVAIVATVFGVACIIKIAKEVSSLQSARDNIKKFWRGIKILFRLTFDVLLISVKTLWNSVVKNLFEMCKNLIKLACHTYSIAINILLFIIGLCLIAPASFKGSFNGVKEGVKNAYKNLSDLLRDIVRTILLQKKPRQEVEQLEGEQQEGEQQEGEQLEGEQQEDEQLEGEQQEDEQQEGV
ncbi:MAG: hypothetical protein LBT64_03090 [Puniceicoccales bacterium]|nr:hypothetical protein [Puniceicoccales bacterium]